MNNHLSYKGYTGTVEYTAEDDILFGKVIGIRGLISYEGESISSIKKCFVDAIDDYLEMCKQEGLEPQKPVIEVENMPQSA
ncbi:MAG: type II toxin-antitoxin system HicB family antitoxin [Defluviitaleaceae bacterium]|nr:type II toxin-antitoxin system HicB family antitoxin [Defluviitaleaceae bacterium]